MSSVGMVEGSNMWSNTVEQKLDIENNATSAPIVDGNEYKER